MHIKQIYFLAIVCAIITSCKSLNKSESKPDLSDITQIYCSPIEFGASMPFVICDNVVTYGRPYEKDGIPLETRFDVDEEGDSLIVFDEYINEKRAGSYQFHKEALTNSYRCWDECYYIDAKEKKRTSFFAFIIRKSELFIPPYPHDVEPAFGLIENYQISNNLYNADRGVLNLSYLLHNNPQETLNYKIPKKKDGPLYVTTSPDGKLRTYLTYYLTGNGHGALQYYTALQYKGTNEVFVIDDFHNMFLEKMKEFDGANYPMCDEDIPIYQTSIGGKTYYLVEMFFGDESPMSFDGKDLSVLKTEACAIFAFHIEKGKLVPSNILDGNYMIELVANECSAPLRFKFDNMTKELRIPIIDKTTHNFNGKYKTIIIGK